MSITTIDSLRQHLQYAMAVEHATVPPYLCALYSIHDGTNQEAAAVIQSVVMEEMLHMALVANLTNAVGGETRVNHPAFIPTYPDYLPHSSRAFQVELQKFSPAALDIFLKIEKPEPCHAPPTDDYFPTIGQFYDAVRDGLRYLVKKHGANSVFVKDKSRQVPPENYYGGSGELIVVHDLKSAERAIEEILEQGEGLPGSVSSGDQKMTLNQTNWIDDDKHQFGANEEVAHYFRFLEIREERYFQAGDTPKTGPRGPVFPVDWDAVWPMQTNPKSAYYPAESPVAQLLDDFNRCYMRLLNRLQTAFTGTPNALMAGVSDMYELKHRAIELMRLANPLDDGKTTVGPSFEYVL